MATDAIIVLERLRCNRESDRSGGSEPYIWPVLIWIDDDTLATQALVGVKSPVQVYARVVIRNGMRVGQVADIPGSVGTLWVRLDDNQSVRQLILAVALWESDETPESAMLAGYHAFSRELGLAIGDPDTLFALNAATTPEQRQPIIDAISARVRDKVRSAIISGLTSTQKVRVALGILNMDDIVDSDFKHFSQVVSQSFNMAFASDEAIPSNRYVIDGQLQAVPVVADPCGAQAIRVRDAQRVVDGIEDQISSLQAQLNGQTQPGELPLSKTFIIAEIARIRREELPPAETALEAARSALAICRGREVPVGFPEGGVESLQQG